MTTAPARTVPFGGFALHAVNGPRRYEVDGSSQNVDAAYAAASVNPATRAAHGLPKSHSHPRSRSTRLNASVNGDAVENAWRSNTSSRLSVGTGGMSSSSDGVGPSDIKPMSPASSSSSSHGMRSQLHSHWRRRVERRMYRPDVAGAGGLMDDDYAIAQQAQKERMRAWTEEQALVNALSQAEMPEKLTNEEQKRYPSHLQRPPPSAPPTSDPSPFSSFFVPSHAAGPSGVPLNFSTDFDSSLRSYAQQWWVRLHNSEHRINTSPYYIGNKSIYYDDDQHDKKPHNGDVDDIDRARHAMKRHEREEFKEATAAAAAVSFPPLSSPTSYWREDGMTSHQWDAEADGMAGLKPRVLSTRLDVSNGSMTARTATTTRHGRRHVHPPATARTVASAPAPAPASESLTARPSRESSRRERRAQLTHHLDIKTLNEKSLPHLTPSWSINPHLLTWKRSPSSMTLKDPPLHEHDTKRVRHGSTDTATMQHSHSHTKRHSSLSNSNSNSSSTMDSSSHRTHSSHSSHRSHRPSHALDEVSSVHGFLSQQPLRSLLQKSGYDRRELYTLFGRFKALCALSSSPHGLDRDTFKTGLGRLAVEDDLFVSRVFSLVDDDGSGCIDWNEFLLAMSALEKGSAEVKARFVFQCYDVDQDGSISKSDLATMFLAGSMLRPDETTEEVVSTFVDKVFEQFGRSATGKISFEDVVAYMKSRPEEDIWSTFGRSMLRSGETTIRRPKI